MMTRFPHDLTRRPAIDHNGCRLVSWNVAARTGRVDERIHAIGRLQPGILALQETTASNLPAFREALPALGLMYVLDSRTLAPRPAALTGPRKYGELLASRWPMEALPPARFEIPWPERVLSAAVQLPFGEVEVHVTHLPTGVGHGWIKIVAALNVTPRYFATSGAEGAHASARAPPEESCAV